MGRVVGLAVVGLVVGASVEQVPSTVSGAWHDGLAPTHTLELSQSASRQQPSFVMHGGHSLPPQSTDVSWPFCKLSSQLVADGDLEGLAVGDVDGDVDGDAEGLAVGAGVWMVGDTEG